MMSNFTHFKLLIQKLPDTSSTTKGLHTIGLVPRHMLNQHSVLQRPRANRAGPAAQAIHESMTKAA